MLSYYLKQIRKEFKITQEELSAKSGIGLRLLEKLNCKTSMRMDKVNQVLALFGAKLKAMPKQKNYD